MNCGNSSSLRKNLKTFTIGRAGNAGKKYFNNPHSSNPVPFRLAPYALRPMPFFSKLHRVIVLEISGNVVGREGTGHAHDLFAVIPDEMP